MLRQTCTDHAACCGRHFNGIRAFDTHRRGGVCNDPTLLYHEAGTPVLQVWSNNGYCDKLPGCYRDGVRVRYEHPVTIWQTFKTPVELSRLEHLRVAQRVQHDAPSILLDGGDVLHSEPSNDAGLEMLESSVEGNYVWVDGPKPVPTCRDCGIFISVKRIHGRWRYSHYCRSCSSKRQWNERKG
jgi:hypothetical protein